MSASADDSATDKKRAGVLPWLFLFVTAAFLVSVLLLPFLRDLRAQGASGAVECAKLCDPYGMKAYDGAAELCECQAPERK